MPDHGRDMQTYEGDVMREQKPPMRRMKVSEVGDQLDGLVDEVSRKEAHIVVEKSGKPVAALVSYNDLIRLKQTAQAWEEDTRAFERLGEAFADVPTEELEAEIARIITENRQRARRARMEAERQPA